jgi:hypothetical protein
MAANAQMLQAAWQVPGSLTPGTRAAHDQWSGPRGIEWWRPAGLKFRCRAIKGGRQ